jgi:hypothetical protein
MIDVDVRLDPAQVARLEQRLNALKMDAPKVLAKALNSTAKNARRDLADKARETYTVKIGGFNSEMRLSPASAGNLEAIIKSQGANLELKKFSVGGGHGGPPLTTTINKQHGKKTFRAGFVNKIAQNGHVAAAVRQGQDRLPIKKLFSVSVPHMLGSEQYVYGIVEPKIEENLKNNVDKEIARLLG